MCALREETTNIKDAITGLKEYIAELKRIQAETDKLTISYAKRIDEMQSDYELGRLARRIPMGYALAHHTYKDSDRDYWELNTWNEVGIFPGNAYDEPEAALREALGEEQDGKANH